MNCKTLHFSRHAFERMFQRGISPDVAKQIIVNGEVIVDYPTQPTLPEHLVTIYWPDPAIWDASFKKRRA